MLGSWRAEELLCHCPPPLWACCVRHFSAPLLGDVILQVTCLAGDRGIPHGWLQWQRSALRDGEETPSSIPTWNSKLTITNRNLSHGELMGCVPGSVHWCFAYLGLTQEIGRVWGKETQNLRLNFCVSGLSSLPLATRRFLEDVSFVIREFTPKYL